MNYLQLVNIITIALAVIAAVILFKVGKRFVSLVVWLAGLALICFFIVTYGNPELLVRSGERMVLFLHGVFTFLRDLFRSVM